MVNRNFSGKNENPGLKRFFIFKIALLPTGLASLKLRKGAADTGTG